MKKHQNILVLKQSEKISFTSRSWMTIIKSDGIEIVSDKKRWEKEETNIIKPKMIKLSKNIHAVYDELKQTDEKLEITAFIGIQPIKGNVYILECLEGEENKDCKSYMFSADFIPLIKSLDNILIPHFEKKPVQISCFEFPF